MKSLRMKKTFSVAVSGLWLALIFSQIAFGAQEPKAKNVDTALTQTTVTAQESNIKDPDAALTSTAFTYQGQLKDANGPVTGSFDFQFTLYSAQTGGEPLGVSEMENAVLTNGMFSFKLDFGRAAVEAKESWLEIGVRPGGSAEAYTVLFPRQKLTPTPYAIFAQHEQWSLIGVLVGFADQAVTDKVVSVLTPDETAPASNAEVNLTAESERPKETSHAAEPEQTGPLTLQGSADPLLRINHTGASGNPAIWFQQDGMDKAYLWWDQVNSRINLGTPTVNPILSLRPASDATLSRVIINAQNGLETVGFQPFLTLTDTNSGRRGRIQSANGVLGFQTETDIANRFPASVEINSAPGNSRLLVRAQDALNLVGFQPFLTLTDTGAGFARSIMAGGNGDFGFYPHSFIGGFPAVLIKNGTGNVGIGTPNPQARLDVAGMTRTGILQITGGSDLSENFEVSSAPDAASDVQPGMLVSIDPENPGKLIISRNAYDRRVAGIVSGAGGVKPGMLMGQEGTVADGGHPVALTGRVYCWADASNGPIEPGDLLTTSNTPGHAMKVTDHTKAQGAILGKAMTKLEQGQGLVLVLVTLQ